MNRRGFLAALLGTAVLDPERLLWVPGKRLISIPAADLTLKHQLELGMKALQQGIVQGCYFYPDIYSLPLIELWPQPRVALLENDRP